MLVFIHLNLFVGIGCFIFHIVVSLILFITIILIILIFSTHFFFTNFALWWQLLHRWHQIRSFYFSLVNFRSGSAQQLQIFRNLVMRDLRFTGTTVITVNIFDIVADPLAFISIIIVIVIAMIGVITRINIFWNIYLNW